MELLSTKNLQIRGPLSPEDIEQLEQEFYQKKLYFSYSSLNKLLWNPAAFYQEYILKIRDEKMDKHLIEGKAIHALLLSKAIFDQLFLSIPGKLPSDNTKSVVDKVFKIYRQELHRGIQKKDLKDYRSDILTILKEKDLHQSLVDDKKTPGKTGDDKRMEKILIPDALDYWEYLKQKGSRDVIDQDTLDFCNQAVEKIRAQPRLMELLGFTIDEFDDSQVLNETEFRMELPDYTFGLKGIIDNIVILPDKKTDQDQRCENKR
jgi:hypothetical protein